MRIARRLCFFLCLFIIVSAQAATDKGKDLLLKLLAQNKVTVTDTFKSIGNLNGYIVKVQGGPALIIYADRDGKYVIKGTIYTADGQDLGEMDKQKYIIEKNAPQTMQTLKNAAIVVQSKKNSPTKHAITVVFEPNCIACHMLYKQLQPFVDSGDVAVRYILVTFLKPSSKAKAATIIQAADPSAELSKNEKNFNEKEEEGGVQQAKTIAKTTSEKIDVSNSFMQNMGFDATPTIFYYDTKGKLKIIQGVPDTDQLKTIINETSNQFDS